MNERKKERDHPKFVPRNDDAPAAGNTDTDKNIPQLTQDNTAPGPDFKARTPQQNLLSVPNGMSLEISRRQLSDNTSFGTGTILVAE